MHSVYCVFWIFFTINVSGIGAYFVCFHRYLKKMFTRVEFDTRTQTTICQTQMGKVKQINIKNRTYYFYNDQINLTDFDARLLKVDKKDYNEITIYYIGYVTVKKLLIAAILTA